MTQCMHNFVNVSMTLYIRCDTIHVGVKWWVSVVQPYFGGHGTEILHVIVQHHSISFSYRNQPLQHSYLFL